MLDAGFGDWAYYRFDRAKDGYPEKADLAAYRFRIRAVSIYKNKSEWVECGVNTRFYKTWKIGALSAKADADEGIIRFQWDAAGSFYGDLAFTPRSTAAPSRRICTCAPTFSRWRAF